MKKKNWLMTIAFAVLALTIVSTCVIGSTYAKFTSKVDAGAKVQAAGFLITGGTVDAGATVNLVVPESKASSTVTVNYFSQVLTDITATDPTITATGALADWDAVLSGYSTWLTNHNLTDTTVVTTAGSTQTKISDVFKVSIGDGAANTPATVVADFVSAVKARASAKSVTLGAGADATSIGAMPADSAEALDVTLTVTISWVKITDAFDTYLGNLIAEYATTAANSSAPQTYITASLPLTATQHTVAQG